MLLVTGGAGFIGSHLVDRLLARGEEVIVVDDFNDFYDPSIKRRNVREHLKSPRYCLIEVDIRDANAMQEIFRSNNIDKIVHLAARAGVRPSLEQPLLYEDVNIRGSMILLELARQHKVQQIVFASSSSVYGATTNIPFTEEDRIHQTISPYAATKYAGELMCHTYHYLYGIPITCLRFFTAYGPRQRPDLAIHTFTRLIYEGKPIPFFGDGSTSRDHTYIDDIIQGVVASIDRPFGFEVFNLGESTTVTLSELVAQIEKACGKKAIIKQLPPPPGDMPVTFADISKARRMLGYKPTTPIDQGLKTFVEWFKRTNS